MASGAHDNGHDRAAERQAVEELLASPVFGRSDQLRQILRYVCAEELAGRGLQLTEYSIGVHALGRPADFSPETDSTVRTRACELRKRLEEYHRREGEGMPIRIELPKGSYRPRFLRQAPRTLRPEAPETAPRSAASRFWLGMALGVALAGLVYSVTRLPIWKSEGERAIERVWGPLLAPRAAVTLVLATPPQLWVRDAGSHPFPAGDPPLLLPAPGDPAFLEWHRRLTLRAEGRLFLHPNAHSPLWGDAAAAVEAARFLAARGVNVELMAEENIRPAALKERDAIVFGREDYSPSVAEFQPAGGHAVRFVPERRQVGVVDTRRGGGPALFRDQGGRVSYGLVTVLTWKASGRRPFRTLMFSGINSDGSHAGLNFMITPERMADLVKRILETGGRGRWPDSFQVVVRTRSVNTYTIQSEFAAFRRLE